MLREKLSQTPGPREGAPRASEERRAETLAARGLFDKILGTGKGVRALPPEGREKCVENLFPQSPLPNPLAIPAGPPIEIEVSEIFEEIRRLKRGKAAALTGWTRELLFPLVASPASAASRPFFGFLRAFFSDIVVCSLSGPERDLLQRGVLTLLGYEGSQKVRPIVVKETFLKVALRLLLRRFSLPPPPGSVFGRPGGSAIGVPIAQAALDNGLAVVCLDAVNAFNTINRHGVFTFLEQNSSTLSPLFPLLNLIYSEVNYACAFSSGGGLVFTQAVTTGTSQGCVSGPVFLEWAKTTPLRRLASLGMVVPSVSDDFFPLLPPALLSKTKKIVEELGKIGLKMNAAKTRVMIPSPPPTLPPELAEATVESSPCSFLGSVVFPGVARFAADASCPSRGEGRMQQFLAAAAKTIEKNEIVLSSLLDLRCSIQIKFAILRTIQWRNIYFITTLPSSPWTASITRILEEMILKTFASLFSLPFSKVEKDLDLQVRIFSPSEDGGLGLVPLSWVREEVAAGLVGRAAALAAEVGLVFPEVKNEIVGIKMIWKRIMVERRKEMGCGVAKMYHKSWMEEWPNRPLTKLENEVCTFAVWYRMGLFSPPDYVCLILHQNLKTMTPEKCFQHLESCSSCGGIFFHIRHEKINNVIHKTFRYHNVPSECNPPDFPLPDNSRGGPDFVVFVGSKVYCGDVVVTKNKTSTAYRKKVHTYQSLCDLTGFEPFPFAISTMGSIDFKSLEILKAIASVSASPFLVGDLVAHAQFEMLRGMFAASSVLRARGLRSSNLSGVVFPSPVVLSPPIATVQSQSNVQGQSKDQECTKECEEEEATKVSTTQDLKHRIENINQNSNNNATKDPESEHANSLNSEL
ncbi:MAG: hypothetical protein COA68_12255 [Oceanobacter sp.]|nr:MAG: hypothetical protein COA68_12255 [Oceanobacter sp.]